MSYIGISFLMFYCILLAGRLNDDFHIIVPLDIESTCFNRAGDFSDVDCFHNY